MKRRYLFLLVVGVLVAAMIALRRRGRPGEVDVQIEEPDEQDRSTAGEADSVELEALEGIGSAYAERLRDAGVEDLSDLLARDRDDLAQESGIAAGRIETWIERARDREDV